MAEWTKGRARGWKKSKAGMEAETSARLEDLCLLDVDTGAAK
jgi:hypothetical protein